MRNWHGRHELESCFGRVGPLHFDQGGIATIAGQPSRRVAPDIRVNGIAPAILHEWEKERFEEVLKRVPLGRAGNQRTLRMQSNSFQKQSTSRIHTSSGRRLVSNLTGAGVI